MTLRRILVTGAAGLIGGAVVRRLAAEGGEPVTTDMRTAAVPRCVQFELIDLSDEAGLAALMRREWIGTVIHCGAISGPMVAADDPHLVMTVNVGGTLNVTEAARLAGADRLVALSSAAVYGTQASLDPVTEEAPLNATDVYGASKIAGETVMNAYRHDFGLPACVLRVASVFGPGRTTDCFLRDLIRHGRSGLPFAIARDQVCRRQFIHIDDVVEAILAAVTARTIHDLAYNIGGGSWLTEPEIVAIASPLLPRLVVADAAAPPRCLDGHMGPLDLGRAADAFGYRPKIGLAEGIGSYAATLALSDRPGAADAGKLFA